MTERGYLLIADITGYTRYLNASELEHAQGVLTSLMELLVDHARPPMVVSQLEGDAVFSFALGAEALGGQLIVDTVEKTYVAFRRALDLMVLNTTCECTACANISTLDLKFFVHHGEFTIQRIGGRADLVGPDVITVHRLAKNTVSEELGLVAYALYTDAAIEALGLDGMTEGLTQHRESYEHIGAVDVWVQDMGPVWDATKDSVLVDIPDDDVLLRLSGELPVPQAVAWTAVTDPRYRAVLVQVTEQRRTGLDNGRLGQGSVYQCFHSNGSTSTETILEWHPFDQIITEDTTPIPRTSVLLKVELTSLGERTAVEVTVSRARGPWLFRMANNLLGRFMLRSHLEKGLVSLRETVEEDLRSGAIDLARPVTIESGAIAEAIRDASET